MNPASAACSKPPNAAMTPTGSVGSGRCGARPRQITSIFRAYVAASMPVPRPVASAGSAPVKAQISAADAVVLAIPMSPVTRHRLPAATRSLAISMPAVIAATAWSRVIAGTCGEVGRAAADLAGHQAGHRLEVGGHPDIDDGDLGARPGRRTR